jgi:ribonuclease-3
VTKQQADLGGLQERLHHRFARPALLLQALTHRSFSSEHNERLEFLGDAVLDLAVSALIFEKLQDLPEGDLSKVRAALVRQDALYGIAGKLQLAQHLRLGDSAAKSDARRAPSILADALEAIIGAVYLDAGYPAAEALVRRLFADVELQPSLAAASKDAKTQLQEVLQGRKMRLPVYTVVGTVGREHQQMFDVECEVTELGVRERGIGPNKRAAEQAAAAAMLITLKGRLK